MSPVTSPLPLPLLLLLALAVSAATALSPSDLELDIRPSGAIPVPPRAFTAAVAEFAWPEGYPQRDLEDEPDAPWRRNMATASRYADEAAEQGADILVFSEYAILRFMQRATLAKYAAELPPVDDMPVICDDSTQHEVLGNFSCLARTHQMYIVANYVEKEPCSADSEPSCPEEGFSLYNTNMVFDRTGALIQTYRKYNLFGGELVSLQTPQLHLSAFRTDFGAVIGLMTCFDILFELPAVEMVRRGVTHFAFPTNWGDELPSLTGLQMHSAWPRGLGVTLLSSGIHCPNEASIGSGIFSGSGALGYVYDYSSAGAEGGVVTALVPAGCSASADSCSADEVARPSRAAGTAGDASSETAGPVDSKTDAYYPIQHYNVSEFVSEPLTGESQRACDGEFCCELTLTEGRQKAELTAGEGTSEHKPTYRLMVLNGKRNFAPHWSTRICAIVLCAHEGQDSCSTFPEGVPPPPPPPFALRGTFGAAWTVFPSVIRTHMELTDQWFYSRPDAQLEVLDTDSLLVAQLYARNYQLDEP